MTSEQSADSEFYQYQRKIAGIAEALTIKIRKRIFADFMAVARPDEHTSVLDVGVTCNRRPDCNFFEMWYPHCNRVTAVGLEDASFLEDMYPGLKFLQADALQLPFPDKSFDLAVSWAVIEHVGSRARQKQFIKEISRVSKRFFVTTPNRWYPIEFHTVTPFIHWLPQNMFHAILRTFNMPFFATEDTLNLLDEGDLIELLPPERKYRLMNQRLFGFKSNIYVYAFDEGDCLSG